MFCRSGLTSATYATEASRRWRRCRTTSTPTRVCVQVPAQKVRLLRHLRKMLLRYNILRFIHSAKAKFFFDLCRCSIWIINWVPYEPVLIQYHLSLCTSINEPLRLIYNNITKAISLWKWLRYPFSREIGLNRYCSFVLWDIAVSCFLDPGCIHTERKRKNDTFSYQETLF